MIQKDDMAQLLLQILNNQDGRMKKFEQTVSQNMVTLEQTMSQNMAALIQGMSQKTTIRGIKIGQGSGQQPQIEVVTTNVDIPIGYPVNSAVALKKDQPTLVLIPL
jgi:hypothetical protein